MKPIIKEKNGKPNLVDSENGAYTAGNINYQVPFRTLVPFLLTVFFHFMLMNPVFPDAQPYDAYIIIVVAVLVVWFNRGTMFIRDGGITRVIPLPD